MSKDFDLKIRLNNIFWLLGCFTRLEVKLAQHTAQSKIPMELTDLDVLGIRILPDFNIDYLVSDCTTNKHVIESPVQRVFWLKGVMDFFGASKGYLSLGTKNVIPEVQRTVAYKLGISILNENNLYNLEKRVINTDSTQLQLNKPESWLYFENNLTNIPKDLEPLLKFRKHKYWINQPYQNLHALISLVDKHKKLFDEENRPQKALVIDLLAIFSLSLLQMSSYVSQVNPENPEMELKVYFYGGYTEMKSKELIVQNIQKLMENIPKQETLFRQHFKLDPDYLPSMFETGFRLLNKPCDSSQILRYLQALLFEKTINKGENQEGMNYLKTGFSDTTKKLTKDIAEFFCNATGLSKRMFNDIYSSE